LKIRGEEIFFAPRQWRHGGGSFTHGGMPVCWPWFGACGPQGSKGHGFAHALAFAVRSQSRAQLVLGASSTPQTLDMWPHLFDLSLSFALEKDVLTVACTTANTGSRPFSFTSGFHPYFSVASRDAAVVRGVDGRLYCDSRVSTQFDAPWRGDLAVTAAFDHVFASCDGAYALEDGARGRTIHIAAKGNKRLVVWNPGDARPAQEPPAPGALAPGDWRHFVCVEPATLWRDQAVTLAPGEKHVMSITLSLSREKAAQ
jgi:glucose-6-phosphate 1-epimerase